MSQELVRYDAMIYAIAECHKIDEVKELHDKARALEIYAKQAMNVDAERKATEVRLRAERRAGELMSAMQRITPQKANANGANQHRSHATIAGEQSQYRTAIQSAGIPERTAQRWQELATVPKQTFENALRNPIKKPTSTSIIYTMTAVNGAKKMDSDSLYIWGNIREWERMKLVERLPSELFGGMTETMQDDVVRILPLMIEWLKGFENE